jgi:hypothetical protein
VTAGRSSTGSRVALALALAAACLAGCYRHGYRARSPVAPQSFVAIDEHQPVEELRWSYFWGLLNDRPFDPEPARCDGKGAGKVVVTSPWYGVPLTLLSLGTVSPARVTVYCATESPPRRGP